jgi:hypothetical protein
MRSIAIQLNIIADRLKLPHNGRFALQNVGIIANETSLKIAALIALHFAREKCRISDQFLPNLEALAINRIDGVKKQRRSTKYTDRNVILCLLRDKFHRTEMFSSLSQFTLKEE